jgi:carbon starvation protein
MLFVISTTMTAGVIMTGNFGRMIADGQVLKGWLNLSLTLFVMVSVGLVVLLAASRWVAVVSGMIRAKPEENAAAIPTVPTAQQEP